jgi:hydroxyacylglutathione hydrolase
VLDVRPRLAYAQAHIDRTLNIPLIRAFTTWAGWLLPDDRELFLIAADAAAAADAQLALGSIGLDRIAGSFGVGVIAEADAAGTLRQSHIAPMAEAPQLQHEGTLVIDVRDRHEWDAGHLEGAAHHPVGTLSATLVAMDRARPVAVHCEGGTRSAIAASLLEQMGFRNVTDLSDGWGAINRR